MSAVALPKRLDQTRVGFAGAAVQPLLKLIQDNQHLLAGRHPVAATQLREGFLEIAIGRDGGKLPAKSVVQPGLGLPSGRFQVNGDHRGRQPGQQTGLDQR